MTQEIWKPIPGYELRYEASTLGKVRPLNGTPMSSYFTKKKGVRTYLGIDLWDGTKYKTIHVHRLILLTFRGPPPDSCVTRHLNGNPTNNELSNLEWGTVTENNRDKHRHGTMWSKLTIEQVLEIRSSADSIRILARKYGVGKSTIAYVKNRTNWKHELTAS